MTSTFSGLYISLRALQAQQKALETAAHNTANANTPGYSRQRAVMVTSPPWPVPSLNSSSVVGQIGTGVDVTSIERLRDQFLDVQRREEMMTLGQWAVKEDALGQIEVISQEPSENGIAAIMGEFWDSWQELSKQPESMAARTTLLETSAQLTDKLNFSYNELAALSQDMDSMISTRVADVNSIATQIQALNVQIKATKAAGLEPNDLLDKRDNLLDDLSEIIDFQVEDLGDGSIDVNLFNTASGTYANRLVDGGERVVNELTTSYSGGKLVVVWNNYDSSEPAVDAPIPGDQLTVSTSGTQGVISDGAFKGFFDVRDDLIAGYMDDLDSLALGLMHEINTLHQGGYDLNGDAGGDFFSGTGAADIHVDAAVAADTAKIAAASDAASIPGDGSNALAIADLRNTRLYFDAATGDLRVPGAGETPNTGFSDFYSNMVARLGVNSQQSQRMVDNQQALVTQLDGRKESISGVSIDEELAHMVEFQHAYDAAAKFMSTLDSMLDTLINYMVR